MSEFFSEFESSSNVNNGEDPVAAFLAREKQELEKIESGNDDFGGFSSTNQNISNGFGDDFGIPSQQTNIQSNNDGNAFLFNNNFETNNLSATPNIDSFNNDNQFNSGSADINNDDFSGQSNIGGGSMYSAISQADRFSQEPEKIKKWRDEQRERLAKKDAEEEQKKKDWRETAKKELEDWYKNRQEQLEKTHAANKAAEADLVAQRDSLANGQEWERVAKLCDFNPKANKNTKDVSRMRSILLQLKQQPLVRNAN